VFALVVLKKKKVAESSNFPHDSWVYSFNCGGDKRVE
jgi:hypothetical protein